MKKFILVVVTLLSVSTLIIQGNHNKSHGQVSDIKICTCVCVNNGVQSTITGGSICDNDSGCYLAKENTGGGICFSLCTERRAGTAVSGKCG